MADEYRQQGGIMACVSAFDAETTMGEPATTNDFVAEIVQRHSDVFIGWASVDLRKGKVAVRELERAIKELGLRGVGELHPICQAFFPNDRAYYPLYEKCIELGVHVTFHTGTTGVGAGLPGGGGYRIKYSRPIYIDDLAADLPELKIVCAHPAIPWLDEEIAIVTHKDNVFMDLSGWHPRFFTDNLVDQLNTALQDKAMFGTDYPWITPEKWLSAFEKLPIKDEVRSKILKENAMSIFDIET
jgi:predicted TIM-barrel fold metal-dependent hydrolase